jgi:hypothetical protein
MPTRGHEKHPVLATAWLELCFPEIDVSHRSIRTMHAKLNAVGAETNID